jgi:hypothetical protein
MSCHVVSRKTGREKRRRGEGENMGMFGMRIFGAFLLL